jgi:hypothetical protein
MQGATMRAHPCIPVQCEGPDSVKACQYRPAQPVTCGGVTPSCAALVHPCWCVSSAALRTCWVTGRPQHQQDRWYCCNQQSIGGCSGPCTSRPRHPWCASPIQSERFPRSAVCILSIFVNHCPLTVVTKYCKRGRISQCLLSTEQCSCAAVVTVRRGQRVTCFDHPHVRRLLPRSHNSAGDHNVCAAGVGGRQGGGRAQSGGRQLSGQMEDSRAGNAAPCPAAGSRTCPAIELRQPRQSLRGTLETCHAVH